MPARGPVGGSRLYSVEGYAGAGAEIVYDALGVRVAFELATDIDGAFGIVEGCIRLESPRPYVGFPSSPGIILASTSYMSMSTQSLDANMCVVKKHDAPHLQNSGVDQAHIAHNANRRVCELIMSS